MDFELSEEQQMLRDGVSRFVKQHYSFDARRQIAASGSGFSDQRWQNFAELGWLALTLPEECGGLGCGPVETAIIAEQFGSALVLEPYAANAVQAAWILAQAGDVGVRSSRLKALGEGRLRAAIAHAEPGARYRSAALATLARPEGSGFRISGAKQLVCHAQTADQLIVSARTDRGPGVALLLVDRDAPGVRLRPYRLLDATPAADIELENVRVEASAQLADATRGADVLDESFDRLLLAEVAYALGAMECVLETTAEYVAARVQFGQPLIKFQATQHRLAEMFVEVQEVRSIMYCALAHLDADPATRTRMISAAKAVTAQAGRLVGGLGIQLHGGIGMTDEYRIGHYFKHLVVFEKLCGDTEHHLMRFAELGSNAPA